MRTFVIVYHGSCEHCACQGKKTKILFRLCISMSIIVVVTSFIFRQVKSKKCNKSHDLMQHVQMVKDEL